MQREQADYLHVRELGGLELLKAHYHQTQFSKHTHEGYCIGVIEEGAQSFFRTGQLHVAPKGDIILVNADEIHTGSSAVESGWRYRAIYPTPEMLAEVSQDFFENPHGAPWFPQAVIHDLGLAQQLCLLFDLLEQKDNFLLKETMYLSTLACLMKRHGKSNHTFCELPEAYLKILRVKELLVEMPETNFSLQDLADMVGLSAWHFLRQFKKYVGLPPHAWLVQARLQKARQLLKQGDQIAMVAQQCGFSDQSHFNRHFKKAMGVTPTQYVASLNI
ncbi:AraC family transcriptional regulator [Acinetobacter sp. P1(2023)]|uniref:helix-turn-helix transcriptional regulator n=1 Tax=unclassified Acinetobacter TaxID=196816 RepID=UPI0021CD3FE1|nr:MULTISPECIES: AraC family transcriptional regulator [unclassified Acinetobacter]MCU4529845.1 AraC family transcriptional regulator [Acinetobacter sp. WU_MDCI_Abxe169]MDC0841928.1 AraC family transcriptional regulator [Acinetobacter sp. P1(2023)]